MSAQNYTPIDDLVKKHNEAKQISLSREAEPMLASSEQTEIQEVVEHEPPQEVSGHLEVQPASIELPPDLKKLGLTPVSQTNFPTHQNIKLPISDDKVMQGLQAPITSSYRWLATLALFMLQQAHLSLKVVHGHVVRVIKK